MLEEHVTDLVKWSFGQVDCSQVLASLHDYSTGKITSPIELRRDQGTIGVALLEEWRLICWRSGD